MERQDILDAIRRLQDEREDAREEYSDLLKDIIADASRKLANISASAPSMGAHGAQGAVPQLNQAPDMTSGFEIDDEFSDGAGSPAMSYTTPQGSTTTFVAATPVANPYEKDLSGFGDVDDSVDFDDID